LTHLKSFDREQLFEDQPKDYLFRCQPINQWFEMCQAEKMKVLIASSGFPSWPILHAEKIWFSAAQANVSPTKRHLFSQLLN
jgi:hypothetical protein